MRPLDNGVQQPSPGGPLFHLQEYYYRLSLGDRTNIARAFRGVPLIADPRFGEVQDWPGFEAYVSNSAAWIAREGVRFTAGDSIGSDQRQILEGQLVLSCAEPAVTLPVLLVGDSFAGGMKRLRIYHSMPDGHLARRRIALHASPVMDLPATTGALIEAYAAGNREQARQAFTSGASVSAPGAAGLEEFLGSLVSHPQDWQACTFSGSPERCALEYNLVGDDGRATPGGCAVFSLESEGLIRSLAIYPAGGE